MPRALRFLFGFTDPVPQLPYLVTGIGLMLVKYLGEAAAWQAIDGTWLSPVQFASPMLQHRMPADGQTNGYLFFFLLWSLPFAWIGASMSVRRAADAGLSPWVGTLFFVPVVNYVTMIALGVIPTRTPEAWRERPRVTSGTFRQIFTVAAVLAALGLAGVYFSAELMRSYGTMLFLATPALFGAVFAYLVNRTRTIGLGRTLGLVTSGVVVFSVLIVMVALEGAICVMMALPLALFFVLLGATLGYAIAHFTTGGTRQLLVSLAALPLLAVAEREVLEAVPEPVYEVVSSVEVAAPPERVWPLVIAFPPLAPPRELLFRAGIAYPTRATIDGSGVGAVRRCEFSTGAFVEPITAWEPPSRLAFSVREQPDPMLELSPYGKIEAPHLKGFFSSTAGEFRLVPLPGGKTRLEGSTWYRLRIHPLPYWRVLAETIVHRIHLRVLEHVRTLAEWPAAG